jgi:hypothetical protein
MIMKRSLLVLLSLTGLLSGGFLLLDQSDAGATPQLVEEWVNANLVRVRINGRWEEFPLIPLAENVCAGASGLVPGHCNEIAPAQ